MKKALKITLLSVLGMDYSRRHFDKPFHYELSHNR